MDIYSSKFWRVVALLLLFDLFLIELTFHHGMQGSTSPDHWDFRIEELRQIEATPRVQALNSQIQTSRGVGLTLSGARWMDTYFPGQSVPLNPSDVWRVHLSPSAAATADQSGKVL